MRTRIVTHTGSDLPLSEAEDLGVSMIYDKVVQNGVSYRNMLELSADTFYQNMRLLPTLPTTSHPSVGEFYRAFQSASEGADEVLFLSVTSKMSGTYATACAAEKIRREEGAKVPVFVYDTLQCSQGMALMVREAVRLASEGKTASEIVAVLDVLRPKIGVYFILDTLKYAKAGGRVGAIKALAADALGIKPLLCFENGLVRDIGVARSFQDGLHKVLERYEAEGDLSRTVTVFHQGAREKADLLSSLLAQTHPGVTCRIDDVGPVIGVYTGPGGSGLAFIKR